MKKLTQSEIILKHLNTHRGITSFEAFEKYGATRLSAIIFVLRKKGHLIENEDIYKRNRYGEPVKFVRYKLVKDKKSFFDRLRFFM